jgi:endoglucanase
MMMMKKTACFLLLLVTMLPVACRDNDDGAGGEMIPPGANGNDDAPAYTGLTESFGTNLSGAEFTAVYPGVDGTHYGYPTAECLDYFKSKGLTLIRFPFRWERIQHTMYGDLVQTEIAKMKTFVRAAEEREMPVILDMHNFARYSFDGGATRVRIGEAGLTADHLCDVWMKLALEFKAFSNIWGYDIMNEPYDMASPTQWKDIAQAVIYRIRTVDTRTPVVVSGDRYSSSYHWVQYSDNLKDLIDPSKKLIYQAHIYFDKDFSGTYQKSFAEEGANGQTGVVRVKPFVEWLKKHNKVGFIGEYGIPLDETPQYLPVLENMLKYLSENGVPGTYWSAGLRWNENSSRTLSIQPTNNFTTDKPQMVALEKYNRTYQNKQQP